MKSMRWVMLAALGAVTFGLVHAAPEQVISRSGVTLVSGGIGVDSQQRLMALEPQFNLKLVFTLVEGNYVSDVNVSLRNAAGKVVVEHLADGPLMMAKLPAGSYSVHAVYESKTVVRKINLRDKRLHTEYLRWAGNPGVDFPLPPEHRQAD